MSSSSFLDMLMGRRLSPEEQVKKWRQSLRVQDRELDKQLRGIAQEEAKAKANIKAAAKRKDVTSCKILAKEVARSRRAKERIHVSKAQINSLVMQLQQQLAAAKIAGTLKKSTEVMKIVNRLIKLPEVARTMQEMSMEMTKAGIIGEMMDDAIDALDEEGIEDEAEEEVDKILFELTDGTCGVPQIVFEVLSQCLLPGLLGETGAVGAPLEQEAAEPAAEEKEPEMDAMQARLAALKST
ncbi:Charged multivesicular body protein 3 [Cladochytrium tenue]|nr:Charged multivesicular body protein 3 [Cladochytrium tenue]